ncbi:hypothetical protein NQ315_016220 [Exocentrus adspersus]|uniref:YqaJ viral recombinase domain-containing protein n=1 Tax=Exocentrus adspersus TaxID=1586481 RepID=A0AAV8VJ31_9CUCU|nr:hypothetical protein NQ315_016220 [Exocentrus adspersus]
MIPQLQATGILYHIRSALDRVIRYGDNLIDNETNNRAELFMSILCKYNAGKRLNLIQRGSFQTRAHLAGLQYNEGVRWHENAWMKLMDTNPGTNFKNWIDKKEISAKQTANRKAKDTQRFQNSQTCNLMKERRQTEQGTASPAEYGPSVPTTLNKQEFEVEKIRILNKLQLTSEEIRQVEEETRGQWSNSRYEVERKDRLTASVFGEVIKRRSSTSCHNLVKKILYTLNIHSEAMEYGRAKESVARQKFCNLRPQAQVTESGLFIDKEYGYLAASPDGLVGANGLLEIKCLYKVHKSGKTLREAVESDRTLCLEIRNDKIHLKRNHNYFYQVQGQLNISQRDICFFIVYINDQQPRHIEAILRQKDLWNEIMRPRLTKFYMDCVLPEIIYRQIPRKLRCIDPEYILREQEKKKIGRKTASQ